MSRPRPPFIADQAWRLLVEFDRPWEFLNPQSFRAGRAGSGLTPDHDPGRWISVLPLDIVTGCLASTLPSPKCPAEVQLDDVVLTTDAGVGKTKAIERLHYLFNLPGSRMVAFLVTPGMLKEIQTAAALFTQLALDFENHSGCSRDQALRVIRGLQQAGRIVFLCDGLDQMDDRALEGLNRFLTKFDEWKACRWVLAGRPYALERVRRLQPQVWSHRDWRFVQILEFTVPQQRHFLGRTESGLAPKPSSSFAVGGDPEWRMDLIPKGGRSILSIPRVLEHLFERTDSELRTIQTPADVYLLSMRRLIEAAVDSSSEARKLSGVDKFAKGMHLLGAIAFCLTAHVAEKSHGTAAALGGNFDKIDRNELQDFLEYEVGPRYKPADGKSLSDDFRALSAMNEVLEHSFFDSISEALTEIQFRSRTLQEFCCAWYLAQHAFSRYAPCPDEDRRIWSRWFYLPEHLPTDAYYYIWQFLCDMPGGSLGTRDDSWVRAVAPLYLPAQRVGTKFQSRRSCEMLYRSWWRMNSLAKTGTEAERLLTDWRSEFAAILRGEQGAERQQAALELTQSFVTIPAHSYRMGSPREQHGMTEYWRNNWLEWLKLGPPENGLSEHCERRLKEYFGYEPRRVTRDDEAWYQAKLAVIQQALQQKSLEIIESEFRPEDETPVSPWQSVISFEISRVPMLNAWYRLFSTEHGLDSRCWYSEYYAKRSETPHQPAIYLSWFDAWAFTQWCRWETSQVRLPFENEWEAVVKFGIPSWDQPYWWGKAFDAKFANAKIEGNENLEKTSVPTLEHAVPATRDHRIDPRGEGVMDLLGNVLEWCQDVYRREYQRDEADFGRDASSNRVLRGGSWRNYPNLCRCAVRNGYAPGVRNNITGFRLSRSS